MTANVVVEVQKVTIEIRIKDGLIDEVIHRHLSNKKTFMRDEEFYIRLSLVWIFRGNFEKFKEILHKIEKDKKFFSYGKKLMDDERKVWVKRFEDFEKKVEKKRKPLEANIEKYTWRE